VLRDARELLGVLVRQLVPPAPDTPLPIVARVAAGVCRLYVAVEPDRHPVLLMVGADAGAPPPFATKHLRFDHAARVSFVLDGAVSSEAALVLTLLDQSLAAPFAALCMQLGTALSEQPAGSTVARVLGEWRRLFMEAHALEPAVELGLWGELWTLAQSSTPDRLLAGWRGIEGGVVDFFVDGVALEVKTGRRPGVHHVSQSQASVDAADGLLLSWAAEESSQGSTLAALVDRVAGRLSDPTALYATLARRGISIALLQASSRGYAPLSQPMVHYLADVPRVRAFDEGVSSLRFVVTLDPGKALAGTELEEALARFGLVGSFGVTPRS